VQALFKPGVVPLPLRRPARQFESTTTTRASIAFRVRAGRFQLWPGKQRPNQFRKYNTQIAFVEHNTLRISTS
jgi:hypothetical protein